LAARHADIWHFFPSGGDQTVKSMCEHFDQLCQKVGRDPAKVEKAMSLGEQHVAGSAEEIRDRVKGLVDAGVHHFIVSLSPPYDRALMRRFAKDVIPAFRSA